jgi:hypothetical protein
LRYISSETLTRIKGERSMKACLFSLLAGVALAVAVPEAHAQRFVYRNTYVAPTPIPGNYSYSAYFGNRSGTQAVVTTGVYPTPYGGYNAYTSTTTSVRPLSMGPYVSAIWDPVTLSYRYASGYTNTSNYSYFSGPAGVPNYGLFSGYTMPNYGFYPPY